MLNVKTIIIYHTTTYLNYINLIRRICHDFRMVVWVPLVFDNFQAPTLDFSRNAHTFTDLRIYLRFFSIFFDFFWFFRFFQFFSRFIFHSLASCFYHIFSALEAILSFAVISISYSSERAPALVYLQFLWLYFRSLFSFLLLLSPFLSFAVTCSCLSSVRAPVFLSDLSFFLFSLVSLTE